MNFFRNSRYPVVLVALIFFFMVVIVFLPELHQHPEGQRAAAGISLASESHDCAFCKLITALRNVSSFAFQINWHQNLPAADLSVVHLHSLSAAPHYFLLPVRAPPAF